MKILFSEGTQWKIGLNHYEIETIATAIAKHSDKQAIHEPYDELLKDADVMSHCFYNPDFPISEWEIERYKNILDEFGCNFTE